ncbi:excinuclease ABC subunit UvrC [Hujiaoplasma nucleasis]|uniref:UvrABC system protein C n=1 Tax=Hujiaoplasma nucleasis TaxID=2725268 RepID=A0A7L6N661_9MOLU|nr:excinuclease ABC subunit UvrC [Hujiaoplasma nucleasis]QLY40049.1 excinuclease ABC subunit UvrC [Hujiaoplasma nucleasis]
MNVDIKEKIKQVPNKPGTYQMLDRKGKIIYVGKAKNLKNRVSSYFVGAHDDKTTRLVHEIEDFTYVITQTEKEAFLLELSQIKQYLPKYNIKLMDNKTYPYIEVTDEEHPIIRVTRSVSKNKKNVFGPYPNATYANETVRLLDTIFPFRKCSQFPKKVCLYYHIGQCLGPCEFPVKESTYKDLLKKVRSFLSGNTKEFVQEYKQKMEIHSRNLEFEKAKEYRDMIIAIEKTTEQQQVIFNDNLDRDIVNFVTYDHYISINILFMRNGRVLFSQSKIFSYYGQVEDILLTYLVQFYEQQPIPDEILLPKDYNYDIFKEVLEDKIFIPQRGKKVKLLEIAYENAKNHLNNNLSAYLNRENKTIHALRELEKILGVSSIRRIDAFDNSNISGQNLVSAMVVFTNGLPDKNEYRKYRVKTVETNDDYHIMKEIIYRRYLSVMMDDLEKPDLVIVDGGLIQLRAAKQVLEELKLDLNLIGLKKNSRHKTESIIKQNEEEIILDKHSNLYSLLYKIQEEVHRFAISYQRNVASKKIYASILDTIPKVGKVTKNKLLKKYKNLENIKNAPREELKALKIQEEAIDNIYLALNTYQSKKEDES